MEKIVQTESTLEGVRAIYSNGELIYESLESAKENEPQQNNDVNRKR